MMDTAPTSAGEPTPSAVSGQSGLTRSAGVAATTQGTARYARRFAPGFVPDFYRARLDGPTMSAIGIGTYLGECDDADDARYERAIGAAIAAGVNVVDTAINYRCQRSERSAGRALAALWARGTVARDEIVVCTKGGYIPLDGEPPESRDAYQSMVAREYIDRGLMAADEIVGGGHCLAPTFLADQIVRSRTNLGIDTIDLYYLHNPEQQLPALGPAKFRERLARAFETLEARAEAGDIVAFGCATWNGLRSAPGSKDHLSIQDLVGVASVVAGDAHRFRAIQLPISLAMSEAVRVPTQRLHGRDVTVLEAAAEFGLAVVASAPLMQAALARGLPAAVRDALPPHDTDAQRALAFVRALPGVATTLVGMRDPAHVTENLAAARRG